MSNPSPLELENFARELFNDAHRDKPKNWADLGSDVRRVWRKRAWKMYLEHVNMNKVGIFDGDRGWE